MSNRWKIRGIVFSVNLFLYCFLAFIEYAFVKSPNVDYLDRKTHVIFHCVVYSLLFIIVDLTLSTIIRNQWLTSIISTVLSPLIWFLTLVIL